MLMTKMSDQTVHKYRVHCTQGDGNQVLWGPDTPTVCPLDAGHSIDGNIVILDTITNAIVTIKEELVPTQGYYHCQGYERVIPSGNVGDVTTFSHSWPYQISLLNAWFFIDDDQLGDWVDANVAKDTVIGAIGAAVTGGDTTITVSSTVLENVAIGFHVNITDGVNLNDLGRVLDINTTNSTITCETAATNSFSPLSPTYVRLCVPFVNELHFNNTNQRYMIAEKKVGGKGLPPNVPFYVDYHNESGTAKKFTYNLEYIY